MRHFLPLLALALLSACHQRQTFDERYNSTASDIEKRAADLDRQAKDNIPHAKPMTSVEDKSRDHLWTRNAHRPKAQASARSHFENVRFRDEKKLAPQPIL